MSQQSALPAFQITVQSGTFAARAALERLMAGLGPLNLDIEEAGTVELVIAEIINNIVEHGYSDVENSGLIHIACAHQANGLHIRVKDKGRQMPNGETARTGGQNRCRFYGHA